MGGTEIFVENRRQLTSLLTFYCLFQPLESAGFINSCQMSNGMRTLERAIIVALMLEILEALNCSLGIRKQFMGSF